MHRRWIECAPRYLSSRIARTCMGARRGRFGAVGSSHPATCRMLEMISHGIEISAELIEVEPFRNPTKFPRGGCDHETIRNSNRHRERCLRGAVVLPCIVRSSDG